MNSIWKYIRLQPLNYSFWPYSKNVELCLRHHKKYFVGLLKIYHHSFHYSVLISPKINQNYLKLPYFWSTFFQSTSTVLSCWNCTSINAISSNFCLKCKKVLPFNKCLNYFEIFGIEQCYEVSKSCLTSNFRKLQNIFHPDKFSIMSMKEQNIAAERSSILNKAYSVLSHPVERAEYLLKLYGLAIEEREVELIMKPEFLMKIMEINEALADSVDKEIIIEIARKNKVIMDDLMRDASSAFLSRNLPEAKNIVAKMKYYNNIYEKIKEYELKFGIVH